MATQHIFTINDVYRKSLEGTWVAQGWGYGWFGGGTPGPVSTVDRINFRNDTTTAMAKGPLTSSRYGLGSYGNTTDAWFGGGVISSTRQSTIDRIIFASDSATAVAKGPLSVVAASSAAHGNTTDAWFGGVGPTPPVRVSQVDRIIFASDSATAVAKGPLSQARGSLSASGNSTDAWFSGGDSNTGISRASTVDRIIFASDSATAVAKGPLSSSRYGLGSHGNTTDAWCSGGREGAIVTTVSTIDRIIFASDTATAVVKGPLTSARYNLGSGGNSTDLWTGGGQPGSLSIVDRLIFSTDTATAVSRGPLSVARSQLAAN
jgi:hypothetical protein